MFFIGEKKLVRFVKFENVNINFNENYKISFIDHFTLLKAFEENELLKIMQSEEN